MWLPYKICFVILHIIALPIHLVTFTVLVLAKQLVCLCAKLFQDFEGPIPSQSCVFIGDRIREKPHSSLLFGLDLAGRVTREHTAETLNRGYNIRDKNGVRGFREYAFRPVLYFGYGFWKKVSDFKINRVHLVKNVGGFLEEDNANITQNEEQYELALAKFLESLHRQPFDENKPLWDCYILQDYLGNPNRSLVIFKSHHMMCDGLSFVKYFYACTGGHLQLPSTFTKSSTGNLQWDRIINSLWVKICTLLNLCTVGVIDYIYEILFKKENHALNYDKNGKLKFTGTWLKSTGKAIDVDQLKKASKQTNCSLVHILLTGVSNGFERYYAKYHGDEPMPKQFHILSPLPLPGHPDLRFVNHWCLAKIRTKMGIKQTDEKLNYFKEETKRCATDALPVMTTFAFRAVCGLLPVTLADLVSKAKATSTIIYTNVVGPQNKEDLFARAKLNAMLAWLPIIQEASALTTGIMSCNGKLHICLTGDAGCFPDRNRLNELLKMMYAEINDICSMTE